MKRVAFICLAATVLTTPSLAQQRAPNSNSQSYSGSSVNVQGDTIYGGGKQKIRQDVTASAIAPGLTAAGVHSCAGSTSLGVGATGFNFGFGTTYEMVECNRRAYAATLAGMGMNGAALALICNNAEVQGALNQTGVVCPQQRAAMQAQTAQAVQATYASASAPRGRAPVQTAGGSTPAFCFNPSTYNPSLCSSVGASR